MSVVISGTGLFTPSEYITNEELVHSFNDYVAKFNEDNKELIAAGDLEALVPSSSEFIKKKLLELNKGLYKIKKEY